MTPSFVTFLLGKVVRSSLHKLDKKEKNALSEYYVTYW